MMDFASAFISMTQGRKVRRSCWKGYWEMVNGEVFIHCEDGRTLNLRETENMHYTLGNIACNDWQVAD